MKIVVAYICVTQGALTPEYSSRFVGSYMSCPPGVEHETVICCNGGPLSMENSLLFSPMDCQFFPRVNDAGWDISAYQDVAAAVDCDMLVCLGESCYFHHPGWLQRMIMAWQQFGPGMYGFFASFLVRAHMNTTAFVCDPKNLRTYPKVHDRRERYEFEHGETAFWKRVHGLGRPTKLVTWDGIWDPFQWRFPDNILWRGDQSNCLIFCNHTDRYHAAPWHIKQDWERGANQPFK